MKLLRFAAAAAAMPALAGLMTAQEFNRLQLDNGADILWLINDPFIGSDPANGNFGGDLYWKAFPAAALRRCNGLTTVNGVEYSVFDLDWVDDATLWAYTLTHSFVDSAGVITPILTTGVTGVVVPELQGAGLGNPDGPGGCAPPGYISGWILQETFVDSVGNPTPLITLTTNGAVNWSFTHYFPGQNPNGSAQSVSLPNPNSCGTVAAGFGGNATLSWGGSTDFLGGGVGENQPDITGNGISFYGGFQVGGGGGSGPESYDGGAEVALLMQEPMLNPRVNTDNGDGFGLEVGLAGLEFMVPIQAGSCPGGIPTGASPTIGLQLYDQNSGAADLALFAGNVGQTLLDLGVGCIPFAGGVLALNPGDPIFTPTLSGLGVKPFLDVPPPNFPTGDFDDRAATSNQVGISASCGLVGATLKWQAWRFSGGLIVDSSQVFRMRLRASAGHPL